MRGSAVRTPEEVRPAPHQRPRRSLRALPGALAPYGGDLLALAFIVVLALAFFSPALKDGGSIGGFDLDLSRLSPLGAGLFTTVHNPHNQDALSQMVVWNALDWRQVHHGLFPLWNDYSLLGQPEFLNFESSVLSLPDLVSYLAPLRDAFLVASVVKFIVAGTGAYVLGRVLGCRPLAATFSGVTFMLSGALANWVSWPLSDVVAWTGWIVAFAVLAYRSQHVRHVVGLAVVIAFSVYGGFPEANILVGLTFVVGLAVCLGAGLVRRSASLQGVVRTGIGATAGVLLSAPLWFPGLQIILEGHRQNDTGYTLLPPALLGLFYSQGYYGLPTDPYPFQLSGRSYYETVAYVGVTAIALALLAVFRDRRRLVVAAAGAALVFSLLTSYELTDHLTVQALINHLGLLETVRFARMRTVSGFYVALLSGLGLDALLGRIGERSVRRAFLLASVLAAGGLSFFVAWSLISHLSPPASTQRFDALIWPVALAVALLATAGVVLALRRWPEGRRLAVARSLIGLSLLGGQSAFLFFAGVAIPTYSHRFFPATPAESTLERIVGNNLVGLDTGNPTTLRRGYRVGFYPNVNIGYGIRLFGIHDPLVPQAYFTTWPGPIGHAVGGSGLFLPDIDSASLARRYGIGYILAPPELRSTPPAGTEAVAVLGGETLYRVPGAAQFSLTGAGRVRILADNGDGRYVLAVTSPRRQRLVLRLTAVPGWRVTVDGHRVPVTTDDGVMEALVVPAGDHEVTVWYWPGRLSEGLLAALIGVLLLAALGIGASVRRVQLRRAMEGHGQPAGAVGATEAAPSGAPDTGEDDEPADVAASAGPDPASGSAAGTA